VNNESLLKKSFHEGIRLISRKSTDTVLNENSAETYFNYAGKIIRNINIERVGFEVSIYDSSMKARNAIVKIANKLHTDTKEKIIRNHLFLHENEPLNPYKIADNERFLRDKNFILDCRILVIPLVESDSIDLLVITRDVFSIGASVGGSFPNAPKVSVYDANIFGGGQTARFDALLDQDRNPKFGYAVQYSKSSLIGSLTNFELIYTELNTGKSLGDETEFAYIARVSRPLVSPYSRLAGGFEISNNWSRNVYSKPDTSFLNYRYKIIDTWGGYNIGINKQYQNRTRHFVALRYFNSFYVDTVSQETYQKKILYNNIIGYLSEFTLYRQDFFKTRYVYGFGRTEDVPYGISLSLSAGYIQQLDISRPYSGIKLQYTFINRRGNFYNTGINIGGYYRNNNIEDLVLDLTSSYYTKAFSIKNFKIRHSLTIRYTSLGNQTTSDWLKINSSQIPGFNSDSIAAKNRLVLHLESVLFSTWSLLGFRFAPFSSVDAVTVDRISANQPTSFDQFWGMSAGLRFRNENLIFGTLELKCTYIPKDASGNSQFVFGFKQNLRIKNSGTFVKAPSLILYN
jgi:hypothetical protein